MPTGTNSLYPGALDQLPLIAPDARETDEGLEHDVIHDRVNGAINAVQVLLGLADEPDAGTVLRRLLTVEARKTGVLGAVFDGGGELLEVGAQAEVRVPYACAISRATLLADQSGSAVVDVWVADFMGYPPTVVNKITGLNPPTLAGSDKSEDAVLSGWSVSLVAGQVLRFNINQCMAITRLYVALEVVKQ